MKPNCAICGRPMDHYHTSTAGVICGICVQMMEEAEGNPEPYEPPELSGVAGHGERASFYR